MVKNQVPKVELKNLDALFGLDDQSVSDIRIEELCPFANHPFQIIDNAEMDQMVASIRSNGIITPIIVRKCSEGYEIISGHRRTHAAKIVGLRSVPAIIREMDDDEAVIAMVDTNLQRDKILPSEKAHAYKMKLEALSHQGKRMQRTSTQVGWKLETANDVGALAGDSKNQVRRYIRLTYLIPELMGLVDANKLKLNPAVELSYIQPEEQRMVFKIMMDDMVKPTLSQAKRIKRLSAQNEISQDTIRAVLAKAGICERNFVLRQDIIMQYFPSGVSDAEIESLIIRLLEDYRKKHGGA